MLSVLVFDLVVATCDVDDLDRVWSLGFFVALKHGSADFIRCLIMRQVDLGCIAIDTNLGLCFTLRRLLRRRRDLCGGFMHRERLGLGTRNLALVGFHRHELDGVVTVSLRGIPVQLVEVVLADDRTGLQRGLRLAIQLEQAAFGGFFGRTTGLHRNDLDRIRRLCIGLAGKDGFFQRRVSRVVLGIYGFGRGVVVAYLVGRCSRVVRGLLPILAGGIATLVLVVPVLARSSASLTRSVAALARGVATLALIPGRIAA